MPIRPDWCRACGPVTRKYRIILYGLILTGAAVVAMLGVNLTILATAPPPGPPQAALPVAGGGTLVICGGGGIPETVRDRFLELAGGPKARIVVIPTAHASASRPGGLDGDDEPWKSMGPASVQIFHTLSKTDANDEEFVRPLKEATGV